MTKWKCMNCGGVRYETVESEKYGGPDGKPLWRGKVYSCKECSVMFRNPYKFNGAPEEKAEKDS